MKVNTLILKQVAFFLFILAGFEKLNAQSNTADEAQKITTTILHLDSLFWLAYNSCDVEKMTTFFTEDVEFYHDKGGLTNSRATLMENTKKGICASSDFRLRREPAEGTVKVFPLNDYGAIITGDHYFFINEKGKQEYRDGLAKFTHVWRLKDNEWKMHRVLSYDHQPAPFVNTRKEISLSKQKLKAYVGNYESQQGTVVLVAGENLLHLAAGDFKIDLYPASDKMFFAKERDLQFEFETENEKVTKMIIHENGNKIDEAIRKK
jgi:hypothetical protein